MLKEVEIATTMKGTIKIAVMVTIDDYNGQLYKIFGEREDALSFIEETITKGNMQYFGVCNPVVGERKINKFTIDWWKEIYKSSPKFIETITRGNAFICSEIPFYNDFKKKGLIENDVSEFIKNKKTIVVQIFNILLPLTERGE